MKGLAWVLVFLQGALAAPLVEPLFSDEDCEDYQKIASEYVELELAGVRWQGGDSPCLKGLKLTTGLSDRAVPVADPALQSPAYLLPESRQMDIWVRRIPGDRLEVKVHYIGKQGSREKPVRDTAILRLNFGRSREARGCASVFQPLEHLVLRSHCAKT
jgi:hypothetical protein